MADVVARCAIDDQDRTSRVCFYLIDGSMLKLSLLLLAAVASRSCSCG